MRRKVRRRAMRFEERLEREEGNGIAVLEKDTAESSRKRKGVGMRRKKNRIL